MLTHGDLLRIAAEATPALEGAVVHRAWRAGDETFVLLFRFVPPPEDDRPDRLALEIGLRPESARVAVLLPEDVGADDPAEKRRRKDDHHFLLAKLRKLLPGSRVERITVQPDDRVVLLDLARVAGEASEPGDDGEGLAAERLERARLAIELTGRATNLVLVDRGPEPVAGEGEEAARRRDRIVAALRPGRAGRELDPGQPYSPPPARPRRSEAGAPDDATPEAVFAPEVEPDAATLALSRAVSRAGHELEDSLDAGDRRTALLKAAQRGVKRSRGLVAKLEQQRDEAIAAEDLRRKGELLKANAARVKKGATSVKVQDFFASEPREVELELDPLVPVMDQARALFKRAKKLDRGLVAIETRLGAVDAEAEALERIAAQLEAASPDDEPLLGRAEKELRKLGCAPKEAAPQPAPGKKKPERDASHGPRKFQSRDGFTILVGRSNEENDRLTITIARGNDLFFHVRGFPGSHVIVRAERDKTVPLETLLDAAALAVHYSKVRGNVRADVSYTPRKYVRKPRGAKPGLVEISNEKTIRPDGDPARLARVLATAGARVGDEGTEDAG